MDLDKAIRRFIGKNKWLFIQKPLPLGPIVNRWAKFLKVRSQQIDFDPGIDFPVVLAKSFVKEVLGKPVRSETRRYSLVNGVWQDPNGRRCP